MYPKYVEIENTRYKINTDFRVAIKCNQIAEDENIGDLERVLAIIYTLFGDAGINAPEHYEKLLELAKTYLLCGKNYDAEANEKPDMDYIEDAGYIASSFQYDYKYNPYELEYVHWYKFSNDLNNLSNSEFGNCCVLNRVRNLRNFDIKTIKDKKERKKVEKAQQLVALKKHTKKPTKQQQARAKELFDKLGIGRK